MKEKPMEEKPGEEKNIGWIGAGVMGLALEQLSGMDPKAIRDV